MKKTVYFIILLSSMLLFSSCIKEQIVDNNIEKSVEVVENQTTQDFGVYENDKSFDIIAEDNEGNVVKLSDSIGKTVIVSFWTSWSKESMLSNEILSEIKQLYIDEIDIMSINIIELEEKNLEYIIKLIREKNYNYNVLYDFDGEISKKYLVSVFPTTYIIDSTGYIKKIVVGEIDLEDMKKAINDILNPI